MQKINFAAKNWANAVKFQNFSAENLLLKIQKKPLSKKTK